MSNSETSIKIGELLVRAGVVTGVDLQEAETLAKHMQVQFGRILIMSGCLTEHDLECALEAQALIKEHQISVQAACEALSMASREQIPLNDAIESLRGFVNISAESVAMAEFLADIGIITLEQLEEALDTSLNSHVPLTKVLVSAHLLPDSLGPRLEALLRQVKDGSVEGEAAMQEIRNTYDFWAKADVVYKNNDPNAKMELLKPIDAEEQKHTPYGYPPPYPSPSGHPFYNGTAAPQMQPQPGYPGYPNQPPPPPQSNEYQLPPPPRFHDPGYQQQQFQQYPQGYPPPPQGYPQYPQSQNWNGQMGPSWAGQNYPNYQGYPQQPYPQQPPPPPGYPGYPQQPPAGYPPQQGYPQPQQQYAMPPQAVPAAPAPEMPAAPPPAQPVAPVEALTAKAEPEPAAPAKAAKESEAQAGSTAAQPAEWLQALLAAATTTTPLPIPTKKSGSDPGGWKMVPEEPIEAPAPAPPQETTKRPRFGRTSDSKQGIPKAPEPVAPAADRGEQSEQTEQAKPPEEALVSAPEAVAPEQVASTSEIEARSAVEESSEAQGDDEGWHEFKGDPLADTTVDAEAYTASRSTIPGFPAEAGGWNSSGIPISPAAKEFLRSQPAQEGTEEEFPVPEEHDIVDYDVELSEASAAIDAFRHATEPPSQPLAPAAPLRSEFVDAEAPSAEEIHDEPPPARSRSRSRAHHEQAAPPPPPAEQKLNPEDPAPEPVNPYPSREGADAHDLAPPPLEGTMSVRITREVTLTPEQRKILAYGGETLTAAAAEPEQAPVAAPEAEDAQPPPSAPVKKGAVSRTAPVVELMQTSGVFTTAELSIAVAKALSDQAKSIQLIRGLALARQDIVDAAAACCAAVTDNLITPQQARAIMVSMKTGNHLCDALAEVGVSPDQLLSVGQRRTRLWRWGAPHMQRPRVAPAIFDEGLREFGGTIDDDEQVEPVIDFAAAAPVEVPSFEPSVPSDSNVYAPEPFPAESSLFAGARAAQHHHVETGPAFSEKEERAETGAATEPSLDSGTRSRAIQEAVDDFESSSMPIPTTDATPNQFPMDPPHVVVEAHNEHVSPRSSSEHPDDHLSQKLSREISALSESLDDLGDEAAPAPVHDEPLPSKNIFQNMMAKWKKKPKPHEHAPAAPGTHESAPEPAFSDQGDQFTGAPANEGEAEPIAARDSIEPPDESGSHASKEEAIDEIQAVSSEKPAANDKGPIGYPDYCEFLTSSEKPEDSEFHSRSNEDSHDEFHSDDREIVSEELHIISLPERERASKEAAMAEIAVVGAMEPALGISADAKHSRFSVSSRSDVPPPAQETRSIYREFMGRDSEPASEARDDREPQGVRDVPSKTSRFEEMVSPESKQSPDRGGNDFDRDEADKLHGTRHTKWSMEQSSPTEGATEVVRDSSLETAPEGGSGSKLPSSKDEAPRVLKTKAGKGSEAEIDEDDSPTLRLDGTHEGEHDEDHEQHEPTVSEELDAPSVMSETDPRVKMMDRAELRKLQRMQRSKAATQVDIPAMQPPGQEAAPAASSEALTESGEYVASDSEIIDVDDHDEHDEDKEETSSKSSKKVKGKAARKAAKVSKKVSGKRKR